MARFARLAPGLDLDIAQPAGDNVRRVADGAVDLAVGVFDALPASLYRRALYEDRLACVLRAAIPTPPPWTWMATWRCATSPSPSPAWARAPWTRPCRRAA